MAKPKEVADLIPFSLRRAFVGANPCWIALAMVSLSLGSIFRIEGGGGTYRSTSHRQTHYTARLPAFGLGERTKSVLRSASSDN